MQVGLSRVRVLHELFGVCLAMTTQSFGPTREGDHPCCGIEHIRLGPQAWTQKDEDQRAEAIDKILTEHKRRQMSVRAKFKLDRHETTLYGKDEVRTLEFSVATADSEENKRFFKYTPYGTVKLGILNKEAWEHFELGKEYYVDFTPAV
jgi:hypothetical protein